MMMVSKMWGPILPGLWLPERATDMAQQYQGRVLEEAHKSRLARHTGHLFSSSGLAPSRKKMIGNRVQTLKIKLIRAG
jgi:hypothetical protein